MRNKEKRKTYNKQYYQDNKDTILPKARIRSVAWCKDNKLERNKRERASRAKNPARWRQASKKSRQKAKDACIAAYGSKCSCCRESIVEFLTLDHVNGGGSKHRKEIKQRSLWSVAREQNYPALYRLLCWNCNWSAHLGNGICIHERQRMTECKNEYLVSSDLTDF